MWIAWTLQYSYYSITSICAILKQAWIYTVIYNVDLFTLNLFRLCSEIYVKKLERYDKRLHETVIWENLHGLSEMCLKT